MGLRDTGYSGAQYQPPYGGNDSIFTGIRRAASRPPKAYTPSGRRKPTLCSFVYKKTRPETLDDSILFKRPKYAGGAVRTVHIHNINPSPGSGKGGSLNDSCPTYASMRNEVLWNEAHKPDYRRILSQGPLVKKAAQFMLRTRQLELSPSISQRLVGPQFACSLAPIKYADSHALSPSGHGAHCSPCT